MLDVKITTGVQLILRTRIKAVDITTKTFAAHYKIPQPLLGGSSIAMEERKEKEKNEPSCKRQLLFPAPQISNVA